MPNWHRNGDSADLGHRGLSSAPDASMATPTVQALVAQAPSRPLGARAGNVTALTRDLDLAEDSVQDAFAVALTTWPRDGVPANAPARPTQVARRKALDILRRDQALARKLPLLIVDRDEMLERADERLRLIFTCCHPALSIEAQVGPHAAPRVRASDA